MEVFDISKVWVTGGGGMLGSYIDFGIKTTRDELDILNGDAVMAFVQTNRPEVIIHLAAATDTSRCEQDPAYAYELNATGTINIAVAAQSIGAVMVYVSTSRVFGGEKEGPYIENDIPDPKTVYGKSKYLGELAVSVIVKEHLIVRACWLFGGGPERDKKFYGNILRQLGNEKIAALEDVYGSPTYAKDFIAGVEQLLQEGKRGIFHVCNSGVASRADIVDLILGYTKSETKLEAVDRNSYENGHLLPANESIASESIVLRPWKEALTEYLQEEWLMN